MKLECLLLTSINMQCEATVQAMVCCSPLFHVAFMTSYVIHVQTNENGDCVIEYYRL